MRVRKCCEDPAGRAALRLHAAAHNCDECQIGLDFNRVRIRKPVNRGDDLLLFVHKFRLMHNDRHGINAGRHVFEGNSAFLKGLQHFSAKANLRVHHILGDQYRAEIFLARDAGDCVTGFLTGTFHNPGAVVFRPVRIADVDRNSLSADRKNRIFMQNTRAHIRQLTQFLVGDRLDCRRIVHNSGIRDKEARDVRPVLVHIRSASAGNNRAGDIGAAAGECFDPAVKALPEETGNYRLLHLLQPLSQNLFCFTGIQRALFRKEDHFRRIDEFISKVRGHQNAVEILAAGSRVILVRTGGQAFFDFSELVVKRNGKAKTLDDLIVPGTDVAKRIAEALSFLRRVITAVQQIRHLRVAGKAFAGSGRDYIYAGFIRADDIADFAELFCVGKGAAAEFNYFDHNLIPRKILHRRRMLCSYVESSRTFDSNAAALIMGVTNANSSGSSSFSTSRMPSPKSLQAFSRSLLLTRTKN